jgi:hypothetical protein
MGTRESEDKQEFQVPRVPSSKLEDKTESADRETGFALSNLELGTVGTWNSYGKNVCPAVGA